MSQSLKTKHSLSSYIQLITQALKGEETDYTTISIRKAIVLLAIPMMLAQVGEKNEKH